MKLTVKCLWTSADLLLLLLLFSYTSTTAAQSSGTFIPAGNMTTPRSGHTATLLLNGKVLITGGNGERRFSAELYDPMTGTFTETGNMTTARSEHSATLLPDGRVLIAGGSGQGLATAELYDPSTETFSQTGNMVTPQSGHTATLLNNGKVLISAGAKEWRCDEAIVADSELYDPVASTFSAAGEYAEKYGGGDCFGSGQAYVPAALLANGKVLMAIPASAYFTDGRAAELYDPATDMFSFTGQRITAGLYGVTATLLTNGKLLIAGGSDGFFYGESANAELYDASTGKFIAAGKMIRGRAEHTATLLRDGTVLISGGLVSPGSAELYNPDTGTFASTGDMTSARADHTATLLMDGRILITGGYTSPLRPTNSAGAELYVPSVLVPAQVVTEVRFNRTSVAVGFSSYSVSLSGSNLTPQTFFDVRFSAPESNASEVVLNWQRGVVASHSVPAGTPAGIWTINGVRAHQIETDHTGTFVPVSGTITVFP